MAERKSTKKTAQKSAKSATASGKTSKGWTAEERAAAKAYAQERKAEARGENDERAALAAIAAMPKPDRTLAERLHAIIKASAPMLAPRLWYGMAAYARDGTNRSSPCQVVFDRYFRSRSSSEPRLKPRRRAASH